MRASRSQWNTCSNSRIDHDHKPEAQAKGVRKMSIVQCPSLALQACCKRLPRKCLSSNALRLRFRLVASDFPGIVCILNGDRSGAVEIRSGRRGDESEGGGK